MKKYIPLFVLAVIFLVIAFFFPFLYVKYSKSSFTVSRTEHKAVETKEVEKGVKVSMSPEGKLESIPQSLTFYFSRSFAGAEGVIVPSSELSRYIKIEPPLGARGEWVSERKFVLHFIKKPEADRTYRVFLKRIPLKKEEIVQIYPRDFTFSTPPFTFRNLSVDTLINKRVILKLAFNYPVNISSAKRSIYIEDKYGERIPIERVYFPDPYNHSLLAVKFKVTYAPAVYKLILRKSLKSSYGNPLGEEVEEEFSVGYRKYPIYITYMGVEGTDDGFTIGFRVYTLKDKWVEPDEGTLKRYITVTPDVKYKVFSGYGEINIIGDFIEGEEYTVTINAGLKGTKNEVLARDAVFDITIPYRKPSINFVYCGKYFGRTGDWKLPVKVVNVGELKINVDFMPQRNVVFWYSVSGGRRYSRYKYVENIVKGYTKVIESPGSNIIWIDLKELIPEPGPGIYFLSISGKDKKGRFYSDNASVVISDISLIVKWTSDKAYVWAVNSSTLKPLQGVDIEIWSGRNFLSGKGTTGMNGLCEVPLKKGRDVYIVYAKKGDDWTYLQIPGSKINTSSFEVSGSAPTKAYTAFIYPERDIYRPGEEIHIGILVRKNKTYEGVSVPVRLKVRDPRGRRFVEMAGMTDATGFASFNIKTSPSSPTGKYAFVLYTGTERLVSDFVFVETFAPERIDLRLKYSKDVTLKAPFKLYVMADYLFGAPASGERVRGRITGQEIPFKCEGYGDYTFGPLNFIREKTPKVDIDLGTGKLDEKGRKTFLCSPPSYEEFYLPVKLNAYVEVSEGGSGRVTRRVKEKIVHPCPFYIGLKTSPTRVVRGKKIKIRGLLLNPDCSLRKETTVLTWRAYRVYYKWDYYFYERFGWWKVRKLIPITPLNRVTATGGTFEFLLSPQEEYRDIVIEVKSEEGVWSQVLIEGWGWYWSGEYEKIESPEYLDLRLEKPSAEPGEMVKVETSLPFEGKILWTVEQNGVLIYQWKEAKGEKASWSFRVPEGYPNVYVSALLVHSGKNYLVARAFGVKRLKIRPKKMKLPLTITVPDKVKPNQTLVVKVKSDRRFKATIAIVDEGILSIRGFRTPDPYNSILRPLALGVNSAEGFGWLMKKYLSGTGGGMLLRAREEEFPQTRFTKFVSFWSGVLESDRNGLLVYKVKVPQFSGRLRVMVCGADRERLGSRDARVVVKTDVVIQPTVPRFLYSRDKVNIPVSLINTTDKKQGIKISARIKGGMPERWKKSITLISHGRTLVKIPVIAGEYSTSLSLVLEARIHRWTYVDTFTIPIYPSLPYISKFTFARIESKKEDLSNYFSDWLSPAHRAQLYVSTIPGLNRLHYVRYAVHYPYGCIEQTSTSTLLLLRLARLLPIIDPDITEQKYRNMVNKGIQRILSMQTVSGGFSYWPGYHKPSKWSSAYATLVLIEARDAGFHVPDNAIRAALSYLRALSDKNALTYYVLARGGILRARSGVIQTLEERVSREAYGRLSLLWIAGALYESGLRDRGIQILEKAMKMELQKERRLSGNFYSVLKNLAVTLYMVENIYPDMAGEDSLVETIVSRLAQKDRWYYYTTQEIAWSMLALGKYMDNHPVRKEIHIKLIVDGREYQGQSEKGLITYFIKNAPDKRITLETNIVPLYIDIVNTGFSKTVKAFEEYNHPSLPIFREVLSYNDGTKVSGVEQGQLLLINVGFGSKARSYSNTAFEVPIPAGCEIENPRLTTRGLPSWVEQYNRKWRMWNPDYVDIRDDRVIIFGTSGYRRHYFILVRAVTPGTYFFPPARAMVMYNPEINSQTGAESFRVIEKE